jgi:hypothetical protein
VRCVTQLLPCLWGLPHRPTYFPTSLLSYFPFLFPPHTHTHTLSLHHDRRHHHTTATAASRFYRSIAVAPLVPFISSELTLQASLSSPQHPAGRSYPPVHPTEPIAKEHLTKFELHCHFHCSSTYLSPKLSSS